MKKVAIGVDVGGTNTAIGVVDELGNVMVKDNIETPSHGDINQYISDLADAIKALEQGYNVAVVMRVKRKAIKPETWSEFPVIDGDESDLRFMDARGGHIVGLTAKGKARYDKSGFVREVYESFNI